MRKVLLITAATLLSFSGIGSGAKISLEGGGGNGYHQKVDTDSKKKP